MGGGIAVVFMGLCAVVAVALIAFAVLYNNVVACRNAVDNAFSSIDVMLKKRADLIPNVVATVKQYMQHESGLLERITALRSSATSAPPGSAERMAAEGQLSGALGQLRVAVESYPDLKANTNFLQLQATLNEIEEQISASRRAFNAAVLAYNNCLDQFPSNIIAGMLNFQRKAFFEISEKERGPVDVGGMFK
jgi:LemA protein